MKNVLIGLFHNFRKIGQNLLHFIRYFISVEAENMFFYVMVS